MKEVNSTVREVVKIADNVWSLTVALEESAGEVKGGQFLNISTGDGSRLLKRPLGIVRACGNEVTVCFQVKGEGTRALADCKCGDRLRVLLPLGNGFDIPEGVERVAVIGGGVGVFPLVPVLKQHGEVEFYTYLGYRSKSAACLIEEFEASRKLKIVTDDGSMGEMGNAVNAFVKDRGWTDADLIIACGPPVMLRSLKNALHENGVETPCLVSLEERMGCGIGACLVCVCDRTDGGKSRVCKDGPVFNIEDVEL